MNADRRPASECVRSSLSAVVFDLDGTLVDSAVSVAQALDSLRRKRGLYAPLPLERVRRWVSQGAHELVSAALEDRARDGQADIAEFRTIYAAIETPRDSLFAGVPEMLATLVSYGLQLGICSNKPQKLCEKVLLEVGIADYFKVVVGGDAVARSKPDPEHLLATIASIGAARSQTVFVGDSSVDALAAQAAGISFVLAAYGYLDDPILNGSIVSAPGLRIDAPVDVLAVLAIDGTGSKSTRIVGRQ